jgi:hypothetical protein
MQHGRAENEWAGVPGAPGAPGVPGAPSAPGVDEEPPSSSRSPVSAVRRFFADRFRSAPSTSGHPGASAPRPVAGALPTYLAAAPPPPTSAPPLMETRLAREIRSLLGTLGTTRGAVASTLEAAGVRATPGEAGASPVGLFLTAIVGSDPNVKSVRLGAGALVVDLRAWWRPAVTVPLPAVVEDFQVAFDAGCYPSLLREECRLNGLDGLTGWDHLNGAEVERSE